MSEAITNPACALGCTDECKAKVHGCASECPALPWQPAPSPQPAESALEKYRRLGVDAEETGPIERLRAFCSFATNGQDWLDVEPFFGALRESPQPAVPVVSDEQIIRAAVSAMPSTNPLVAEDLIGGHTMHTEAEDIVAIWKAGVQWQALHTATQPCGHPVSLVIRSAESGEALYCEACDDKSGRRDAEMREAELLEANQKLRDEILALRPAVEPMTDEVRRSYQCLLAMNTPHGFGDRIGPFVKWLQDSGITAKAEDAHQGGREGREGPLTNVLGLWREAEA